MPKTLKNFIFTTNVLLIAALFILVFVFTTYLHTGLAKEEAVKHADAISDQVFVSMYQVMKRGWNKEELNDFVSSLKENFDNTQYEINIYRSQKVKELFGEVNEKEKDELIERVLNKGEDIHLSDSNTLRNIQPLIAKKECLACHVNAKQGDTLGAIEVRQNLLDVVEATFLEYVYFFLIVIPLFILAAFVASRYTTKKISSSIELLHQKVQNVNSLKDFRKFNAKDMQFSFQEIDEIMVHIDSLASKLKAIAVDKELLEFEVQLLDKLMITSDIVRDWREYISQLLIEINHVMPTYTLMTIFHIGDEQLEVDVFWHGIPKDETLKLFEHFIKESISQHEQFYDVVSYSVNHNYARQDIYIDAVMYDGFMHRTKTLFLETPKIGGIVGLSVQSDTVADPIRHIVIDSILTTLANLVGSVKAINRYTHELEYYAAHDPLTGLFNQRIFYDLLDYEIKRSEHHGYKFAILMIDCDNFKPINDKHGHVFGDLFLQEFAELLSHAKRAEDILCRYGGDEFVLILTEITNDEAMQISQNISTQVRDFKLLAPDDTYASVTVSIGLSIYPDHGATQKELFLIADEMMYKAKESGKDGIKSPSHDDILEFVKDQEIKREILVDAVSNNRIVPFFQPIHCTQSGKNEIHELLMRIEVDGKIIPAHEFIEVAESMSIINRMDLMIIENAFIKIKEENYQGTLFINLSPKSLIVANFTENITSLIMKYDIPRERVVFEITERETVKNFALLEKFVLGLKMAGYQFAIDDFGSGFSSFHYIKKFPIDYIKIDGEFIININKDPKDRAFVNSIVTLAKELGVKIVAEFVEDEEIAQTLRSMGVDYLQGYHIGRPQREFTLS